MVKQFENALDGRFVTFIAAPINYRPNQCSLKRVPLQPDQLFQKVIGCADRFFIHQLPVGAHTKQSLSLDMGVKVTDTLIGDSVALPFHFLSQSHHSIVSHIQDTLTKGNVLIVTLTKSKMRF